MATKLPDWRQRQQLLYGPKEKRDFKALVKWGKLALDQQQVHIALDFFQTAEDPGGLEEVKARAIEEGDSFLLQALESTSISITMDDWKHVEKNCKRERERTFCRFSQTKTKIRMTQNLKELPNPISWDDLFSKQSSSRN